MGSSSNDSPLPTPTRARPAWASLATEERNPRSLGLDRLEPEAAVRLLLDEDRRGLEAALAQTAGLATAAGWLAETLAAGGDAVLAGAGTSGRLAVLEAAECPPTFGTAPERIRAAIAGGPEAVFAAREGAEDRADEGAAVGATLRARDLLIGVSASAVTPFVRGAIGAAQERGARTVLLTCAAPGHAAGIADLTIALATGAEVLTGSTRLKAGSATKAALNAITTVAMVQLGKVYENWMVDLRAGSAKLRDRARRIVAAAAGVSDEEAARLLGAAGGEVKAAIVMGMAAVEPDEARRRIAAVGGQLWRLRPDANPADRRGPCRGAPGWSFVRPTPTRFRQPFPTPPVGGWPLRGPPGWVTGVLAAGAAGCYIA